MEVQIQSLSKIAKELQKDGKFVEALDMLNKILRLDPQNKEADEEIRQLCQATRGRWIHYQIDRDDKIPEEIYNKALDILKKVHSDLTEIEKKYVRLVASFLSGSLSLNNFKDTWGGIIILEQEEIKKQQEDRKAQVQKENRQPEGPQRQPKQDPEVSKRQEGASGAGQQLNLKEEQQTVSKVFISYSHDSEDHRLHSLWLSNRLRNEGVDCEIDWYHETPPPAEGWPQWMRKQIKEAGFVLVVCTETYRRRFEGTEEIEKGKGAKWEGAVITQLLYDTEGKNSKFIPVLFKRDDHNHIPDLLRSTTFYHVISEEEEGYEALYRRLTNQPFVNKPKVGIIRDMPAKDTKDMTTKAA